MDTALTSKFSRIKLNVFQNKTTCVLNGGGSKCLARRDGAARWGVDFLFSRDDLRCSPVRLLCQNRTTRPRMPPNPAPSPWRSNKLIAASTSLHLTSFPSPPAPLISLRSRVGVALSLPSPFRGGSSLLRSSRLFSLISYTPRAVTIKRELVI